MQVNRSRRLAALCEAAARQGTSWADQLGVTDSIEAARSRACRWIHPWTKRYSEY